MGRPIDSQELREAMYHEAFETDSDEQRWDSGCWIRYKMFERVLDSLPTAQPERKIGRWEKVYGEHIYAGLRPWTVCCSECGMIGGGTRYCPNCGADMRTPTQVQLDEADDVMMGGNDGKTD